MITLDQHQWHTLTAIQQHIRAHGYPPTTRELARAMGFASNCTSNQRLCKLVRAGVVHRTPIAARAITLQPVTVILHYEDAPRSRPPPHDVKDLIPVHRSRHPPGDPT